MDVFLLPKKKPTSFPIMILGFLGVIVLMRIGGSPGSTAGGMKTTTVAVLFATAISAFRRQESAHFFGRRIDNEIHTFH